MKKSITLVMMALLAVVGVKAQTWTASEVGAGDFYLYNVGAGKFLNGGNSWGTQASLNYVGIETTLAKVSEGVYTISTAKAYGSGKFMNKSDGTIFLDQGSANWTFEAVAGQTNTYLLKLGSQYLTWSGEGTALTLSNDAPTTSNGYFKLVSKANLIADMTANATYDNGVDASFYIANPEFSRNAMLYWQGSPSTGSDKHYKENFVAEKYDTNPFDVYQEISGMENGIYKVSCYGFYRAGGAGSATMTQNAILYANDETSNLYNINTYAKASNGNGYTQSVTLNDETKYVPNYMQDAGEIFNTTTDYSGNNVDVVVIDGNLRIGVKKSTGLQYDWALFDKFSLTYYGRAIANDAVALPNTTLTAGSWYYFDIPSDDNYDITVTTLSDVVYTTDGTIPTAQGSTVTDNFSGTSKIALTTGRYYIKSSSAQAFSVAPHSVSYSVGAASFNPADGAYVQSSTLTVTFPDATTNDLEASSALVANSTATVNGNSVNLVATTGGFTLDLGTLTAGTDYTVAIPAGVYGYAAGSTYNAAINITLHTPQVFDGVYYMYNQDKERFLGRGSWYATRAVVDLYGNPVYLSTNASNQTTIKSVDNNGYIKETTWNYADGTEGNATKYTVQASDVEGYSGYRFNRTGTEYLYVNNGVLSNGYSYGVASNSIMNDNITHWKQTVWQLKTIEQHDAIVNAYDAASKNSVISSAGISTTAANLETYLSENYVAVDRSSLINPVSSSNAIGTNWTWGQVIDGNNRTEKNWPQYVEPYAYMWQTSGYYRYTIDKANLPAGIYKLKMAGFDRRGSESNELSLETTYGKMTASYLKANDQHVRLKSWKETIHDIKGYSGSETREQQAAAMTEGVCDNVVYVYLDGNTDLVLTIEKPDYTGGSYMCFGNFALTYYSKDFTFDDTKDFAIANDIDNANVTVTRAMTANVWNTLVVPFDMDIPSGWTVMKPTAFSDGTLSFGEASSIEAGKPYIVKPDAAVTSFSASDVTLKKDLDPTTVGDLTMIGTYTTGTVPMDSYVIGITGTETKTSALYKVNSAVTIAPFRAYFTIPNAQVKANVISLNFDGTETSIEEVDGEMVSGASVNGNWYNLAGQRVNNPKRGLYVVNGKKVIIK